MIKKSSKALRKEIDRNAVDVFKMIEKIIEFLSKIVHSQFKIVHSQLQTAKQEKEISGLFVKLVDIMKDTNKIISYLNKMIHYFFIWLSLLTFLIEIIIYCLWFQEPVNNLIASWSINDTPWIKNILSPLLQFISPTFVLALIPIFLFYLSEKLSKRALNEVVNLLNKIIYLLDKK
jgi:hypothetical protein